MAGLAPEKERKAQAVLMDKLEHASREMAESMYVGVDRSEHSGSTMICTEYITTAHGSGSGSDSSSARSTQQQALGAAM